jgi:hypothetical protein
VFLLFFVLSRGDKQQDISAFEEWLDANNPHPNKKFKLQAVSRDDSGYLGDIKVVATEDIMEGELIYTFPNTLYIDSPHIGAEIGEGEEDPRKLTYHQAMIIHLIHELNSAASKWSPFLNILPKQFYTPIFWSPSELAELRGTSVYRAAKRENDTVEEEYHDAVDLLDITKLYVDTDPNIYTLQKWKWAHTVLRSRGWQVNGTSRVLPVVELFNYATRANVGVAVKGGVLEFVTNAKIAKGEAIIINDGLVGNKELLEWYGFVVPNNPHDYYPVGVGLDTEDRLYGFKKNLFKEADIVDGATYLLQRKHVPPKLLMALRIYHVSLYDHSEAREAFQGKLISSQNELRVCETVIDLCESTLEQMEHSLKSDGDLLRGNAALPRNLYSAIIIRRSEKSILRSVLKMAKMKMEDVKSSWNFRSMDIPTIKQDQ